MSSNSCSSASLKAILRTPSWTSLSSSMRARSKPHIRYSGADRMPGLPIEIPKCDRKIVRRIGDPDILRPLHKVRLRVSGHRDPGEIAFDIGGENRGSRARKPFRENLQGHGLAGAGGARDESVPVAER